MSTGADEHGWQAVATLETLKLAKPSTFANQVGDVPDSVTWIVFAWKVLDGPHHVDEFVEQRVVITGASSPVMLSGWFRFEYCVATDVAEAMSGSCCAPASAAASA